MSWGDLVRGNGGVCEAEGHGGPARVLLVGQHPRARVMVNGGAKLSLTFLICQMKV